MSPGEPSGRLARRCANNEAQRRSWLLIFVRGLTDTPRFFDRAVQVHGSSGARAFSPAAPCGKGVAESGKAGKNVVVIVDGCQNGIQDVSAYDAALEDGPGANLLSVNYGAVQREGSSVRHLNTKECHTLQNLQAFR